MNKYRILLMLLVACSVDGFWAYKKIELNKNQKINSILITKGRSLYIGGRQNDINTQKAFIIKYNNIKEKESNIISDFDCNTIVSLNKYNDFIIATGIKYIKENIDEKKFYIKKKQWKKIDLPYKHHTYLLNIKDSLNYLFFKSYNQFGDTYLETNDGGKTWNEKLVIMKSNRKDIFYKSTILDNKLYGIKSFFPDYKKKSITYLNLITYEYGDEIPLNDNENIIKMKVLNNNIFLLTQVKGIGFIKKINFSKKKIKIVEKFTLKENNIPSDLILFNDFQIVILTDVNSYFPNRKLIYKKINQRKWNLVNFPNMTQSLIDFDNGLLIALKENNQIIYRNFGNGYPAAGMK